jgi:predicted porin
MQKKLLAVAVAGVLAAPGVALAQSSVTISGIFKISMENVRIGSRVVPGLNNSATRLADDSSRIIFNVTEDLGGGLAAVGQLDIRFKFDDSGAVGAANVGGQVGQGNTWVGLRSKSWGMLTFGRNDLHYGNTESTITTKAISLRQDPISLIAYIQGTAIATASRSQNVTRWLSPNWGGFTLIAAYMTNGAGNDSDLSTSTRKGNAWNLNPNFEGRNFQVGYSYWNQKADGVAAAANPANGVIVNGAGNLVANGGTPFTAAAAAAASAGAAQNQRGDRLYGSFTWAGFKLGLAWDKSKLTNALTSVETNKRTAWSLPISWTGGNHNVYFHYTKAGNDKDTVATDGAKMVALGYVYDMSKRTSVGISYSKISNDAGATYNHFTTTSLGDASAGVAPGEDPRILAATIRHAF